MRPRTLIGILAATLVVALAATAALEVADRAEARATYDEPETGMLAEVPEVAEPDAPVLREVELPTEPLVRPELEPKPAPRPEPKPRISAGFLTVATHVPGGVAGC